MGNRVEDNITFWNQYDWQSGGEEWSAPWGNTLVLWHGTLMPRIAHLLPTGTLLEIAPGFGRFANLLKDKCTKYVGIDLSQTCIDSCRKRFEKCDHMEFYVNDGLSLDYVEDNSVNFVFSHDSLVHAEANVLESYLDQLSRKLVPGGYGFIHFSNFGGVRLQERTSGVTPVVNEHGRAENMSADLFVEYCKNAGLSLKAMELIDWGVQRSDGIALFARESSADVTKARWAVNDHFMEEADRMRRLAYLFGGIGDGNS